MKVEIRAGFGKLKEVKISMANTERQELGKELLKMKGRLLWKTYDGKRVIFEREEDVDGKI